MGGTFDPVHHGHLRIALGAAEALALERVCMIPLHQPSHRSAAVASSADRARMVEMAVIKPLVCDDREIRRGGVSRTVETLEDCRREWPENPLCLLLGMDAFNSLDSWHRAEELTDLAHLVVAARPGSSAPPPSDLPRCVQGHVTKDIDTLKQNRAGNVLFLELPELSISSSDIRKRCRNGLEIAYLVPASVREFIVEHGLYE